MIKGKVFDRYGNELELDEDEPLPDGATLRVPPRFMDRFDFMDDGTSMARLRRAYGMSDELRDAQERAQRAYNERSNRLSEAWKHKPLPPSREQRRSDDRDYHADEVPRTLEDAQRIAADAWERRRQRLSNAWRGR